MAALLNHMKQREAKYIFLVNWIKDRIGTRELRPGEKLYSENELSEMFDLSRQTVRHAIGILEAEGLVERIRGSGTYIGSRSGNTRKKTMNIAVISTYVDGYIFPPTLQGIVQTLSGAGYMTQIAFTNNRVDNERKILEGILEKDNVDGVIVEATKSALPNPNLHYYEELKAPDCFAVFQLYLSGTGSPYRGAGRCESCGGCSGLFAVLRTPEDRGNLQSR